MRRPVTLFVIACSAICVTVLAADSDQMDAVEGTWTLTTLVKGKPVDTRTGILRRTPEGVGFTHLDDGEFRVPGEEAGSRRFTVPMGFHFRIEPIAINNGEVVADLLLSHTVLKDQSDVGFSTEKRQVDGRYEISFKKPHSVTLSVPEVKTTYTLTFQLRRAAR